MTQFNDYLIRTYCFQSVAQKVGLSDNNKKYFALFLREEHDFGKTSTALGSVVHIHVRCSTHRLACPQTSPCFLPLVVYLQMWAILVPSIHFVHVLGINDQMCPSVICYQHKSCQIPNSRPDCPNQKQSSSRHVHWPCLDIIVSNEDIAYT